MNLEESYRKLEITPGSSVDEIKTAYRRLAKKYHPDINPSGKDKFTSINEAYEFIINYKENNNNKSKTSSTSSSTYTYTRTSTANNPYTRSSRTRYGYDPATGQSLWEEIYSNSTSNFYSNPNQEYGTKGPDKYIYYQITKEDKEKGKTTEYLTKQIQYIKRTMCPLCCGSGRESKTCPTCGGTGIDKNPSNNIITNCFNCKGMGSIESPSICPKCSSKGFINNKTFVRVRIPTNIKKEFTITLPGKGDDVVANSTFKRFYFPGDLVIKVIPYRLNNKSKSTKSKTENLGVIRVSLIELIQGKMHIFERGDNKPSVRINIKPNSSLGKKDIEDTDGNRYTFQLELNTPNYNILNTTHMDMINYLSKNNII